MQLLSKRLVCGVSLTLILAVAAGESSATTNRYPRSVPVVLHARFQPVGVGGFFMASGQFVFLTQAGTNKGVLIDESTGRSTEVSREGCDPVSMGGPWLLFRCSETELALYRMATNKWRTLNITHAAQLDCPTQFCGSAPVGAHWIRLSGQECDPDSDPGPPCAPPRVAFQSIDTGRAEQDPARPGGRVIADLNSPKLVRRLCSPLRVPKFFDSLSETTGAGPIDLHGPFAIATTVPLIYGQPAAQYFLEQCGSKLRKRIARATRSFVRVPVANEHMVLWQKDSQALTGLFLPSMRPFTIAIPAKAQGFMFPLVISGGQLYAQVSGQTSGEVWKVALPAIPK